MTLGGYSIRSEYDYFEADESFEFGFPCYACKHRVIKETDYPCNICGYNGNAEVVDA